MLHRILPSCSYKEYNSRSGLVMMKRHSRLLMLILTRMIHVQKKV